MVILSLGKKGSGKTALLRKLAYHRLRQTRSLIWWHDPGCQVKAGKIFESIEQARETFAKIGVPRLCVFRDIDVEALASLAISVKDLTLVIDEMDLACSGKKWIAPSVERIVHYGRHLRCDLFGTFRSTRNVSEDLLNAVDYAFLFRHNAASEYDIHTIRRRFGISYSSAVTQLQPLQFVIWSDD